MATQITRIGSAVTIEISEEMLRRANLAVGDPVEWTLTPEGTLALQMPHDVEGLLAPDAGREDYEEWKLREIEAGIADCDAGRLVDHERVVEWLNSWGTDHELPCPERRFDGQPGLRDA